MTVDEKKVFKQRIATAEKLEARIADLNNLAELLTWQRDHEIVVKDFASENQLWKGVPLDILNSLCFGIKLLEDELAKV